jgi:oligoendopeptidase F
MTESTTLPTRAQVPENLQWDYKALYADEATWETDFRKLESALPGLTKLKGTLGKSGASLLAALTARDSAALLLDKLYAYASMRRDEDLKNTRYNGMSARITTLWSHVSASTAYMLPEIQSIDPALTKKWLAEIPGLGVYLREFELVERARPHTRSAEVSEVIASAAKVFGAPATIHEMLSMNLKFPNILDSKGELVQVEDDNLNSRWLRSTDRGERKRGFNAVMKTYDGMRDTFAACYSAQVDADIFDARQHGYGSSLEAFLGPKNIPVSVYTSLIEGVHAGLPLMARYLELRKRLLGLKELRLYDLYAPVRESTETYDWEKSQKLILAALAPMGEEYVDKFHSGYTNRWYDVLQTQNKRGGAWGGGGYYSSYPYSLLNHHGDLESVFTAAHEGGHCMHSLLSRESQTFQDYNYVIFTAEVASTLNEALLEHHLLETAADDLTRLTIVLKGLEAYRTTMFRQTLFGEFEMIAHAKAEKGKPLTADALSNVWRGLYRKYYGSACTIDRAIGAEWMRIPHFYSAFYVPQYCTGMACARDLSRQLLSEGEPARRRIIDNFLRAGGSKDPVAILQNAGTDPTTPHPVAAAMKDFEALIERAEKLVSAA